MKYQDRTVLIIEDDMDAANEVAFIVRHLGCQSIITSGEVDSVEYAKKHDGISVLLVDFKLKEANGYDVVQSIWKAAIKTKKPEAVMMTGYADINLAKKLLDCGFSGLLTKPLNRDDVRGSVISSLRKYEEKSAEATNKELHHFLERNLTNAFSQTIGKLRGLSTHVDLFAQNSGFIDSPIRLIVIIKAFFNVSEKHLPDAIFNDVCIAILLELFRAKELGVSHTITSLCYTCHAPMSTTIRKIADTCRLGLAQRVNDDLDKRRVLVEITNDGYGLMKKIMVAVSREIVRDNLEWFSDKSVLLR